MIEEQHTDEEAERENSAPMTAADREIENTMQSLLDLLPPGIMDELSAGEIDPNDEGFLEAIKTHIQRIATGNPQLGSKLAGKMLRISKIAKKKANALGPTEVAKDTPPP